MRLGSMTVGPFKWNPKQADRLKYYSFEKRCSIDEIVQIAVNQLIDRDTTTAASIDDKLQRQYGDGDIPLIRNVRDLRRDDRISFACEDKYANDPNYPQTGAQVRAGWRPPDERDSEQG